MFQDVPTSMLSKHGPALRDHIAGDSFESLPYTKGKAKHIIGYVVPVWLARAYKDFLLKEGRGVRFQSENTREFARRSNRDTLFERTESEQLIYVINFVARDNRPSQAMAVVSEDAYSEIACLQKNGVLPKAKCNLNGEHSSNLNMVMFEHAARPQDKFWGDFTGLRREIADNHLVYRKAIDMVAIPVPIGRLLKQHAYFGEADRIVKVSSRQSERSSRAITESIDNNLFVHVNGRQTSKEDTIHEHMVVPILAAEFLACDSEGIIKGLRETKTKQFGIDVKIAFSSNMDGMTYIHSDIESEAQRQIVQRALQNLNETEQKIELCGHDCIIDSVSADRDQQRKPYFHIPTSMRLSATLSISGSFSNAQITISETPDITHIALDITGHCELHFNGQNYHLRRICP